MLDNLDLNVIDYIKAGQYIQAIKRHRELTGMGLKESKEYVDKLKFETEIKALKATSIDEMRDNINKGLHIFSDHQIDFLLDLVDEAFYLGEDSGQTSGYMKSLEENNIDRDDEECEESYNIGFEDGREQGHDEGYDDGRSDGYNEGREEGFEDGKKEGYIEGKDEGYDEGYSARMEEE